MPDTANAAGEGQARLTANAGRRTATSLLLRIFLVEAGTRSTPAQVLRHSTRVRRIGVIIG